MREGGEGERRNEGEKINSFRSFVSDAVKPLKRPSE